MFLLVPILMRAIANESFANELQMYVLIWYIL